MFGTVDESAAGIYVVYRVDVNKVYITGMSANTVFAAKAVPMNGNPSGALSRF
jgi:poly(3-hydroxybutyrate) depolymerase